MLLHGCGEGIPLPAPCASFLPWQEDEGDEDAEAEEAEKEAASKEPKKKVLKPPGYKKPPLPKPRAKEPGAAAKATPAAKRSSTGSGDFTVGRRTVRESTRQKVEEGELERKLAEKVGLKVLFGEGLQARLCQQLGHAVALWQHLRRAGLSLIPALPPVPGPATPLSVTCPPSPTLPAVQAAPRAAAQLLLPAPHPGRAAGGGSQDGNREHAVAAAAGGHRGGDQEEGRGAQAALRGAHGAMEVAACGRCRDGERPPLQGAAGVWKSHMPC